MPWQIGHSLEAVEFAEIGLISEHLRVYLAHKAGQSHRITIEIRNPR